MKKILCMLISAMLLIAAAAAETPAVYVSITDGQGNITTAFESVELIDADGDGAFTIHDALYCVHEQSFEGGASEGYLAEDQGYGLSLYKLWGEENGGSYGYYVNNTSAFSLTDPVVHGDHVKAYAYTDLETWSDTYCYFDKNIVGAGETELTLTALVFDENWNQAEMPVEGAVITIDGAEAAVTDADGKAVLSVPAEAAVISAHSDSITLVPPVCLVEGAK